jgi:pimeloyl-ACP methyl ester carboxylesterase
VIRKVFGVTISVLVAAAGLALASQTSPVGAQDTELRPMIFVHGGLGSGNQFVTQALRFTSNGYPDNYIEMFEHNSLAWPDSQDEVWSRIDQLIDDVLADTGAEQVNLLGHSQGTGVLQGYLNSDPARAANVAQYVNLDGGSGGTVPTEVETLAIWGEGSPDREIPGATNIQFPDQGHTEVVNSPETFAAIYEFFTGEDPEFPEVVREPADEVELSGRVQLFPENVGAPNRTLEIYEVEPETGARLSDTPDATFSISGDGHWGPFDADGDAFYEFAVNLDEFEGEPGGTHHIYRQPFPRSNRWVHLLTSNPGGLADSFWERTDDRQNLVIIRDKEQWGDQGDAGDRLEINGQNVLNEATSPRANRTIGIFVYDDELDGVTDLSEPVLPFGVSFLTGVDVYIPGAVPPTGTTGIVTVPRLGDGPESICVPNWAADPDATSIHLWNFHFTLHPDGSPAEGHPNPECEPPPELPEAPAAPPVVTQPVFTG